MTERSLDAHDPPAAPDHPGEPDLEDPAYYLNRELGELAFQRRVLGEALDEDNPLLERVKFLEILTRNVDEFFMKRVGGLKQQVSAGVTALSPDGRTPEEQLAAALPVAGDLLELAAGCYHDSVRPALAAAGIEVLDYDELDEAERLAMREYFEGSVLPTLTPLTFDPSRPFPFISNLSLSLAVLTEDDDGEETFSRVKVPSNLPRLVRVHDDHTYVPLESVVEANLDLLFPNVEVRKSTTFRVTRNAEVRRDEDVAEGLIDMIEGVLRERRFATAVRLELAADTPASVRDLLVEHLGVDDREVFELPEPLGFRGFGALADLDRPDLSIEPWVPQPHPRFSGTEDAPPAAVFEEIARGDVLVHHPYHSFEATVQRFLDAAATDPDTLAIKVAIYRTAPDSAVLASLIEAVNNGTEVAVNVELQARFDEENNLRWVKRLEEEGIHVAYGAPGLKTHAKTALVVREEDDGVGLYSHVATGNYHAGTARSYSDLGVLTADPEVGRDLVTLFNSLTGTARDPEYRKLLVAPGGMRSGLTDLVRREAENARAGREARIVMKMNSLEDPGMVRELYEASMAGVEVDLIVRGVCRLRPGIEGVSESVRVHSVVGRFLEHSRIFYFHGDGDPEYVVGSADLMTRNLDRRVEAAVPVEDPDLRAELDAILALNLADDRKRWVMDADGRYERVASGDGPASTLHDRLMDRARAGVVGDPIADPGDRAPDPVSDGGHSGDGAYSGDGDDGGDGGHSGDGGDGDDAGS